jgi:hypothetical protein
MPTLREPTFRYQSIRGDGPLRSRVRQSLNTRQKRPHLRTIRRLANCRHPCGARCDPW